MRNKKQGSTLITVLSISLILMALSGIILKSISNTMNKNNNQKIKEDLKYIAESGLEIARSYFEKNGRSTIENDTNNIEKLLEVLKGNSVVDLKIEISDTNSVDNYNKRENIVQQTKKMKVKCIAIGIRDREEISCEYSISGKGFSDIFDYSMVAGQGSVNIRNCFRPFCNSECINYKVHCLIHCINDHPKPTYDSSSISSNGGTIINGENVEINGETIKENQYSEVQFIKNTKLEELVYMKVKDGTRSFHQSNFVEFFNKNKEEIVPTYIKIDKDSNMFIKEKDAFVKKTKSEFESMQKESILLLEIEEEKDNNIIEEGNKIQILMINSKKVEMEIDKGAVDLFKQIAILRGELFIVGQGALKLSSSTIFSSKISSSIGYSFDLAFQASNFIKDSDRVNNILENIIPNWNNGGEGTGSGIIFNEKSFNNN